MVSRQNSYPKYLFLLLFVVITAIAFFIVRPYITTLLAAAITAYVFYPVHSWFVKHTHMKRISALITILIILLIVTIPFALITSKVTQESYIVYLRTKQFLAKEQSTSIECQEKEGIVCGILGQVENLKEKYGIDFSQYVKIVFTNFTTFLVKETSNFILAIPTYIFYLFIFLFAVFFLLLDGKDAIRLIRNVLPLKEKYKGEIFAEFNRLIYATVYGAVVMSLIQGVIAGIGYFIFGLESPVLWALITVVVSFIPFFGTFLVWFPASVKIMISGFAVNNNGMIFKGFGLMLWGALLVGSIDNFLKPKIIGSRAGVHPLIILLGVFGGLALFGVMGIVIGPILLALFISFLKIFEQEKFLHMTE